MNRFLRLPHAVVILLLAVASVAHAAGDADDAATARALGQWHGSLQAAAGSFALELTIASREGTLAATLESVDQAPGQTIAASRVELDADRLKLEIAAIGASYEGRFDAATDTWQGSWQQSATLPLNWARGALPVRPTVRGIDGVWRGSLTRGGTELRLILHVGTSARGTRAKLDSPDMGLAGMDVVDLVRDGNRVRLRVPIAQVAFDGQLLEDHATLTGTWRREGRPEVTVTFTRDAPSSPAAEQRPQTPRAPFAYAVEDVTFHNRAADVALAGTLTLPRGRGPFAAAVLISGSGPEDRDETLLGHKPFAVLADHLTRHGIAALRFDKRGVGESSGDFGSATTDDFAGDVRAALDYLATRPEIDARAIGLIGHSEGGVVGPLAATRHASVAYLVLLAAPATGMADVLIAQHRMAAVLQGRSESSVAAVEPEIARLYAAAGAAPDRATARARVRALLTPERLQHLGVSQAQAPALVDQLTSDWLRDILRYDAAATLGALDLPMLALNGSLDRQVPAQPNLDAIRRATARNDDVTTLRLEGLNHLFQNARSGAIAEYTAITETISPTALQLVSDWINTRFPVRGDAAERARQLAIRPTRASGLEAVGE